jgi:hypothetical protein
MSNGDSNSSNNNNNNNNPVVDLDQFLNLQPDPDPNAAEPGSRGILPEMDRVTVVGIFVDDSGSMDGLGHAVLDGLALAVSAFKGAKGSDFYLDVRGFRGELFSGPLKNVQGDSFKDYAPEYNCTPLVTHTKDHLRKLHEQAKQYQMVGIPTTVALLIITDGLPNEESCSARDFAEVVGPGDYVVGMGITKRGESGVASYKELFREMKITKTVTPTADAAEVRHAINQFSQSVASIATA